MTTDKLATLEARNDATTLIRGTGLAMLRQFSWAVLVPEGVLIPTEKTAIAQAQLKAMGYRLTTTHTKPAGNHHTSRDWPECGHCRAPYLHRDTPTPGQHCTSCGQPLDLVNPADLDRRDNPTRTACRSCGRTTEPGANYCRCGEPTSSELAADRRAALATMLRPQLFALPDEKAPGTTPTD